MTGYLVPIGFLIIFIGIAIVLIGSMSQGKDKTKTHIGFGGFIGPIPFGFANSPTALYITIGAIAFFFILWLILRSTL